MGTAHWSPFCAIAQQLRPDETSASTAAMARRPRLASAFTALVRDDDSHWDQERTHRYFYLALKNRNLATMREMLAKGADPQMPLFEVPRFRAEPQGQVPLHLAARLGDCEMIACLIDAGGVVDSVDEGGDTPLFVAMRHGHRNAVEALIDAGADVLRVNEAGETLLHLAARNGVVDDMFVHLMDLGIDMHAVTKRGNQMLHYAASTGRSKMVEFLLGMGADPSYRRRNGKTPLHMAVRLADTQYFSGAKARRVADNFVAVVQRLLSAGADFDVHCDRGCTPLHEAAAHGFVAGLRVLIEAGADVNARSQAVERDHVQPERWEFFDTGRDFGGDQTFPSINIFENLRTPLHVAARRGLVEGVKLLIDGGADINAITSSGHSALHLAASARNFMIIESLIDAGADVNIATNDHRRTPLHEVVSEKMIEGVQLLLRAGADVDAATWTGATPLLIAAESRDIAILESLIDAQACVNVATDGDLRTPLHVAARGSPDATRLLVLAGADVTARTAIGETALHWGARSQKIEILESLIIAGAEVDAPAHDGRTPLHEAAACNFAKGVERLIHAGADVNSRSHTNETPLHLATQHCNLRCMKHLINAGADLDAMSEGGETPLSMAVGTRDMMVVGMLVRSGAGMDDSIQDDCLVLAVSCYKMQVQGAPDLIRLLLAGGAEWNSTTEARAKQLQSVDDRTFDERCQLAWRWMQQHRLGLDLTEIPEKVVDRGIGEINAFFDEAKSTRS